MGLGDILGIGVIGEVISDEIESVFNGNFFGDFIDFENIVINVLD